jgi:hypothetical protein
MANGDLLTPMPCQFLGDDILYFFYGRPSYRVNAGTESTSQEAFHSVCFLIESCSVSDVKSIFPFDTGAFVSGYYKDHLHHQMRLEDFALSPDLAKVTCFVETFYESNANYYMGRMRSDLDVTGAPMAAQSYHSLVKSKAVSLTDTRRSSVEVQTLSSLDVRQAKVLAVFLPESLLDQPEIRDFIENDLSSHAVGYFCIHASPREDMALIMREVREFYKSRGLI